MKGWSKIAFLHVSFWLSKNMKVLPKIRKFGQKLIFLPKKT